MMVANIISPILTNKPSDMLYMLAVQCIPAGVAVTMATFGWWSSAPPSPPSPSADAESESFLVGLKALARNRQYYLLAWAIGGGIALFSVFTTLLSQILCPWGYTDSYVGVVCGSALIGAGFVGSAIAGFIVDKTKRFIEVTKLCYALAIVALVVFAVMHNKANQWVVLTCMCGLFGFFSIPVYPIGNELAVETTYPVGEATSSGIVFMSGIYTLYSVPWYCIHGEVNLFKWFVNQLQGLILILLLQSIGTNLDPKPTTDKCTSENLGDIPVQDMSVPVYVMTGYGGFIALVYIIFFRTEYKRLHADKCKNESEESSENDIDNEAYIKENQTDKVATI
ncbi:unnamed protein product [Clavelina lepadiformis]|uniref:Uncharacterized protein n=1 Tax=Clavelina lepadiformis TaxID=159417 RepID=A0ABP0FMA9_CLALP